MYRSFLMKRAMSPKVKGFVQAKNWFQDFSTVSMQ
jgi:hypothetical protein